MCLFLPTALPPCTRSKAVGTSGKLVSGEEEELMGTRTRRREPSFLRALLVTFGPSFLLTVVFKLIQDLLNFVNPQLLRSPHSH